MWANAGEDNVIMNNEPEQIASELSRIIRGDVYTDILHRAAYSTDASIYRVVPQCVVIPRDAGDIAAVPNWLCFFCPQKSKILHIHLS